MGDKKDFKSGHVGSGIYRLIVLISLCLTVFLLSAVGSYWYLDRNSNTASSDDRLKVAVMMAFSGGSSSMGYGALKGVELAQKQLATENSLEIIQMDSKCDPKVAAAAIKQLIAQKVSAIIGEGCSSASVAALPAANNAQVLMLSPSASSPTLSIPDDYFFRVVPPDSHQGKFMAQVIYDRGIRRVAVFYTNEPYGSGMNTSFREAFESLGGQVVATASAEPDVINLNEHIENIKKSNPDGIFIAPNSGLTAAAVVNLARSSGITSPLFGADILYDQTIIQNGSSAAEGLIVSTFPTGTRSFKQSLVNEYQKTEQLYAAAQAYDAIKILQIAQQKGARSGEDLKRIIPTIKITGVSGQIEFDQNGDISNADYKYDLFEVKNGEFRLIE